jgi:hypothetical protein
MRPFHLLVLLCALARVGAAQTLVPYQQGQLWGYRTAAGAVAISPRYQHAEPFRGGLAKVWLAYKCGYVDAQGHELIPVQWDAASYQADSVAWLPWQLPPWPAARQWVLVMELDVPPPGDRAEEPRPAFLDDEGRPLQPWQPAAAAQLAKLRNQLLGFYTPQGQVVLPAEYTSFQPLTPAYFAATHVVDHTSGRDVEPHLGGTYHVTGYSYRPTLRTQLLHRSGWLALQGQDFPQITSLQGDTLVVGGPAPYQRHNDHPAELRDTTGRVLLARTAEPQPRRFGTLAPLGSSGLWCATYYRSRNEHTYLLRPDGTLVLGFGFANLWPLDARHAIGILSEPAQAACYGVLGLPSGAWLVPPQYDDISPGVGASVVVRQGLHYRALTLAGRPLLPLTYDDLHPLLTTDNQTLPYWYAQRGARTELLDAQGRPVLSLQGRQLHPNNLVDSLTLVIEWDARREAVVRLDTTQHRARTSLTLRPRRVPNGWGQ